MQRFTVDGGTDLSGDQGAAFLSDAVDISASRRRGSSVSVQVNYDDGSGTPVGPVTVEGSLDNIEYCPIMSPVEMTADPADGSPIVFTDITGFNYIKLRWARVSGTLKDVRTTIATA
jgi:hypothetical protein